METGYRNYTRPGGEQIQSNTTQSNNSNVNSGEINKNFESDNSNVIQIYTITSQNSQQTKQQ